MNCNKSCSSVALVYDMESFYKMTCNNMCRSYASSTVPGRLLPRVSVISRVEIILLQENVENTLSDYKKENKAFLTILANEMKNKT